MFVKYCPPFIGNRPTIPKVLIGLPANQQRISALTFVVNAVETQKS